MKSKNRLITILVAVALILVYSTILFIWDEGKKDAEKTKAESALQKK